MMVETTGNRLDTSTAKDVSMVKIRGTSGGLVAVAVDMGGPVVVVTADDPDFETFCAQYGIRARKAEVLK